jgi:hypothetical protein
MCVTSSLKINPGHLLAKKSPEKNQTTSEDPPHHDGDDDEPLHGTGHTGMGTPGPADTDNKTVKNTKIGDQERSKRKMRFYEEKIRKKLEEKNLPKKNAK